MTVLVVTFGKNITTYYSCINEPCISHPIPIIPSRFPSPPYRALHT